MAELLIENGIVALVVIACAIFSAWRLLSLRLRLRMLDIASHIPGSLPQRWISSLRARILSQLSGGCAACSHNKVMTRRG